MTRRFYLPFFTVIHFAVDLTCIYCVNALIPPRARDGGELLFYVVLYNLLAFALPVLLGIAADLVRRDRMFAAAGCLLISLAALSWRDPLLTVVIIGTGNGLFHIGAGREVLIRQGSRMSPSGIFISSGALGVFLGRYWGRSGFALRHVFFILPLICGVLLLLSIRERDDTATSAAPVPAYTGMKHPSLSDVPAFTGMKLPVLCAVPVFAVVFIRSYYGTLTKYDWNDTFLTGLIFTLCIVLGKMLGGIFADLASVRTASFLSLLIAGATALLSFRIPFFGCASVLLFNMTMPVTLSLMAGCIPSYPGAAFGVLMFALFLGTLPSMVSGISVGASGAGLCILCIISLMLLYAVFFFAGVRRALAPGKSDVRKTVT